MNRGATSSKDGWGFLHPPNPTHSLTPRFLGCCSAAPRINFAGNRGSGGAGVGAVFSPVAVRRRSQPPQREQRDLCGGAAPEPALRAGTTVPLVTAGHGPLGDGSVPCHGPRDARRHGVLEAPLCGGWRMLLVGREGFLGGDDPNLRGGGC